MLILEVWLKLYWDLRTALSSNKTNKDNNRYRFKINPQLAQFGVPTWWLRINLWIITLNADKIFMYLLFFLYSSISNWSCCWCSRAYSTRATVSLSVSSPYINPQLKLTIGVRQCNVQVGVMKAVYRHDFCITSARL